MQTKVVKAISVIAILLSAVFVFAQSTTEKLVVSGRVTDAQSGRAIAGVVVTVKGTQAQTRTNAGGIYTISVRKGRILLFTSRGYQRKEVRVTSTRCDVALKRSIALKPDEQVNEEEEMVTQDRVMESTAAVGAVNFDKGTDEVVVVGYGTKCKRFCPPVIKADEQVNDEEYAATPENRFKDAKHEPLSTFSLDVDAAAYGNARRMINMGQKPEKASVRIEEFINYFSYNYPAPNGNHPVNILTESQPCPWAKDHLLVRIGVKAKEIPSASLPASNFVFLVDVSGSMDEPNKLPLVKSSLKLLANNLRDKDRVSIVVYAGAAGVVLPSTSGGDKQKILESLNNLQAGGSTAGGAGIQLAYGIAEKNFIKGGNNRVILCTDGDFNVGVSSEGGLENLISEKRQSGIYLTVLGYGMGNYKDNKLQILAQKGNGNHAYIDNIQEANRVLVNEFGSTMYAVAKDVKIQVEFNPAYVNAYRLVGYESRLLNKEDFNDDTKDAGELGAGHTVTAFYEIIPVGVKNNYGGVDDLKYQKSTTKPTQTGAANNELMTVKLRYKPIDSNTSQKMEQPVLVSDKGKTMSEDYAFASAVAMFGQLLKNSDFKGDATYQQAIDLARKGMGEDRQGYRHEFIRLVEAVKSMGE
ncbi:vWA domain-containing protein [Parabacteroides sp. FAFU027]|uniref:vWA domain-containing protein n=1 Tax=Parabacteroides sp. FAFU027 TaxID=2922715 RepID=UPI001FAE8062|nr:VWA domain-containing protein [Parabacteroides sp. FAFU027]